MSLFDFDFEKITSSKAWDDGVQLAKVAIAANGRQPVGSMQLQPVVKTKRGTVEAAGQATSDREVSPMGEAFQPLFQALGAKYANRELNRNPPYWLFALLGIGLAGLYIVVKK